MYFATNPRANPTTAVGSFAWPRRSSSRRSSAPRSLSGLWGMGDAAAYSRPPLPGWEDDAAILYQTFQGQTGAPGAANVQDVVKKAMSQGALYTSEDCSGAPSGPSTAQLVTQFGSMAAGIASKMITFAGVTGPAAPIVAAIGG